METLAGRTSRPPEDTCDEGGPRLPGPRTCTGAATRRARPARSRRAHAPGSWSRAPARSRRQFGWAAGRVRDTQWQRRARGWPSRGCAAGPSPCREWCSSAGAGPSPATTWSSQGCSSCSCVCCGEGVGLSLLHACGRPGPRRERAGWGGGEQSESSDGRQVTAGSRVCLAFAYLVPATARGGRCCYSPILQTAKLRPRAGGPAAGTRALRGTSCPPRTPACALRLGSGSRREFLSSRNPKPGDLLPPARSSHLHPSCTPRWDA